MNLDAKELFPFYKRAEELGCSLFIHPWEMMGEKDMPQYWLPWLVGMPAETTRAICSLIFGGVFENFPKLRFAFAHGGGSFPYTLGRIAHGFSVRPDLTQINNTTDPSDYMGRFWVDSLVHDENSLAFLRKAVGDDKICMGSDYPFPLGEHHPGALIESLELSEVEKHKLLFKNALDWLGLMPGNLI
jgi:aminocarboxymuconate-semialdehyde decarboxylase